MDDYFPCIACNRCSLVSELNEDLVCRWCFLAQCECNTTSSDASPALSLPTQTLTADSEDGTMEVENDSDSDSNFTSDADSDTDSESDLSVAQAEVQALGFEAAVCSLFTGLYALAHERIWAATDDVECADAIALLHLVMHMEWDFHRSRRGQSDVYVQSKLS
ncbi:hypothetical protein DFH06DRAFT_355001 [Mycena polygramma]|nr:hypothetical protein DFH06DRAFT_355001 [Mycena polygramma]